MHSNLLFTFSSWLRARALFCGSFSTRHSLLQFLSRRNLLARLTVKLDGVSRKGKAPFLPTTCKLEKKNLQFIETCSRLHGARQLR
ncbi:hypothetical protein BC830DRAFT_1153649 [Chytriomyces sp. MP71]|nr:hypothetical protein BC830DRAFT_1153649 [Chytriomyces sp. MP71]